MGSCSSSELQRPAWAVAGGASTPPPRAPPSRRGTPTPAAPRASSRRGTPTPPPRAPSSRRGSTPPRASSRRSRSSTSVRAADTSVGASSSSLEPELLPDSDSSCSADGGGSLDWPTYCDDSEWAEAGDDCDDGASLYAAEDSASSSEPSEPLPLPPPPPPPQPPPPRRRNPPRAAPGAQARPQAPPPEWQRPARPRQAPDPRPQPGTNEPRPPPGAESRLPPGRDDPQPRRGSDAALARLRDIERRCGGVPWQDPQFPAGPAGMGVARASSADSVLGRRRGSGGGACGGNPLRPDREWRRFRSVPTSSRSRAGYDPAAIQQGELGDCWFLGALGVVAQRPELLRRVFMSDRPPQPTRLGVHCVRFWGGGVWDPVFVDDRFPVTDDGRDFAFGAGCGALWVPLAEKAYAKRHGGYAALATGCPSEALTDLTGCPCERLDLKGEGAPSTDEAWRRLEACAATGCLLAASCDDGGGDRDGLQAAGLVPRHCYAVARIEAGSDRGLLLRNPWGPGTGTGGGDLWLAWDACHRLLDAIHICFTCEALKPGAAAAAAVPCGVTCGPVFALTTTADVWVLIGEAQPRQRARSRAVARGVLVWADDGADSSGCDACIAFALPTCRRLPVVDARLQGPARYRVAPIVPEGAPQGGLEVRMCVWSSAEVSLRPARAQLAPATAASLCCAAVVGGRCGASSRRHTSLAEGISVATAGASGGVWTVAENARESETVTVAVDGRGSTGLHGLWGRQGVCVLPGRSRQLAAVMIHDDSDGGCTWRLRSLLLGRGGGLTEGQPAAYGGLRSIVSLPPAPSAAAPPQRLAVGIVVTTEGNAPQARSRWCAQCGLGWRRQGGYRVALLPDGALVDIHSRCEGLLREAKGPTCTHCGESLGESTVITLRVPLSDVAATLHPDCVDAFRGSRAPRCAHCRRLVLGDVVLFTPDGGGRARPLHQRCSLPYGQRVAANLAATTRADRPQPVARPVRPGQGPAWAAASGFIPRAALRN